MTVSHISTYALFVSHSRLILRTQINVALKINTHRPVAPSAAQRDPHRRRREMNLENNLFYISSSLYRADFLIRSHIVIGCSDVSRPVEKKKTVVPKRASAEGAAHKPSKTCPDGRKKIIDEHRSCLVRIVEMK